MTVKKVLITGGAGFIGSHLAEQWINQNAEVIILDNLRSGKLGNIEHLTNAKFINKSITDKEAVLKASEGVDYIYNLAALVSVPESVENPYECVDINVNGVLNLLEAAKKNNVKKVVHFSSAAVYGDNPLSPKTINMKPEPKSPYGITKLDGEYYLNQYHESFGVKTLSFRCFNVFGPRQNPDSQYAAAIPIFVNRALKGEELIIYGDGEQTRDFIFVKDVVNANITAALKHEVTGVFNLGTGTSISINELVNMIMKLTSSKSKVIYEAERSGDIKHSLASIRETVERLNFKPEYDLKAGVEETIKYFIDLFSTKN
jgi:UDP-glucose 4-epimerase